MYAFCNSKYISSATLNTATMHLATPNNCPLHPAPHNTTLLNDMCLLRYPKQLTECNPP